MPAVRIPRVFAKLRFWVSFSSLVTAVFILYLYSLEVRIAFSLLRYLDTLFNVTSHIYLYHRYPFHHRSKTINSIYAKT